MRPEVIGRNRSDSRVGINLLALVGLCAVALLGLACTAYAVPPDPPYEFNTAVVNATGPEVTVFDHSTQACQPDDIPDIAARAINDSLGRTQLIVSHYNTRREIGSNLNNVAHNCNVVFFSDSDPDPSHYNYQEWIHSIYTPDGQNVFGFVHDEYHGWDFYEECAALIGTPDINKCWYNAITLAKSTNAGDSFTQAAVPNHLIAAVPYQFAPLQGPYGIYRPSNIHLQSDGYYYMLALAEPHGAQQQGICALRTKNLASASSWRGWDGSSYSVRFIDPYVETSEDPADHVCKPVSSGTSGPLRGFEINSLTFNTYYNKWMIVGQTVKDGIPGFYFVTSDDMLHWSEPVRLMEGELPMVSHVCGDPDPVRDGAVLDPNSSGRNYEYVGQTANLYFTRFNYFYDGGGGCSMTLDRDLIKYPIQFTGSPPTASLTLEDLTPTDPLEINDAFKLDASGSTDPGGSVVEYDWDLDGDGTFEITSGSSSVITGFNKLRDGEAAVRVYDNTGLQDEERIHFTVDAKIDIKPSWAGTNSLYSADTGAAYSDTTGYGWVREDSLSNPTHTPLDLSANTFDRDPLDKDTLLPKIDTGIFMQYPSNGSNPRLVKTNGAFEIAAPCGVYAVTASVGDSSFSSLKRKPGDVSNHRINIEGQPMINFTPTDNTKFASATKTVSVCDGRLTIDAIGGTNTKLNYIDVQRVTSSINFQPDVAETPSNYAKDTGAPYSDSRGYGWVREDSLGSPTHTPLDLSANTIDRDPYDVDKYSQKEDTTIFMQYPAAGSNSRLVKTPGAFEMAVPCDDYAVTVSVGDSAWSSFKKKPGDVSTHRINIEGVNAIAGFTPTDDNKFTTVTKTVNVCDGRLTIDAIGGTNTKLNYVEIARL